jgi:hypothetical protein
LFRFTSFFLISILLSPILNAVEIKNNNHTVLSNGTTNIPAQRESRPYVIFADFLYWTARESGADNWALNFSIGSSKEDIDILSVPFKWNLGLRCGIDYNLNYNGWDIKGIYTWFLTQGKDRQNSISGLSSPFLGNFYINNADGSNIQASPKYARAQVRWTILFNIFDWELGRKYYISSHLILRPFAGLKGGWIQQKIHTKWLNPINVTSENTFLNGAENLKNDFWGIGPSIGIDSEWKLGCLGKVNYHLFADFSGAILGGRWSFKDIYQNDQPQRVSVDTSNLTGASSMLKAVLGLKCIKKLISNRVSFYARIGFESQVWLNQLQFYSYNTGRLSNPLTLQGAIVDLNFNF